MVQALTPFISSLYPADVTLSPLTPATTAASLCWRHVSASLGCDWLPEASKMTSFVTEKCLYDMFFYIFVLSVFVFFYNCTYEQRIYGISALYMRKTSPTCFYFKRSAHHFLSDAIHAQSCGSNLDLNQRNWKPRFHFFNAA